MCNSCIVFKSDAKVVHFCELCKKKMKIFSTINVNSEQRVFAYISAAHKAQQIGYK